MFIYIFIAEFILKLIALGVKGYFHDTWRQFDFCIVFTSLFDIFDGIFKQSNL